MTELNPNHPVTKMVHAEWHKLAAIAVLKAGGHIVITLEDLARMPPGGAVTVQELEDGIHLRIVDAETADRVAREQGGLPA